MTADVDPKLISRVRKLLAMANGAGASQAEAEFAAERAREMMAEHGMTIATLEAGGGQGEGRAKRKTTGLSVKEWQRGIMYALAQQSFVTAFYEDRRDRTGGHWDLIGRESAVVTCQLMHVYLVKTVLRTTRETYGGKYDEVFMKAMGERIAERIEERHDAAMYAQKQEAAARQAHANSHPGTNALVVVLEDFAAKEADLNNDLANGWAPGTTARRREEELREQEAQAAKKQKRREELRAAGLEHDVVELMLYGYSEQQALKILRASEEPKETEEERAKRKARAERERRIYEEREDRRRERAARLYNSSSFRAGRAAGDNVGLDTQVNQREVKKLT